MEFTLNFDNMPDYALTQTSGEAAVSGFDDLLSALVNAPEWKTGTKMIVDHRKLITDHLSTISMNSIKEVVEKYSGQLGDGRTAFVVDSELGFAFARMYEMIEGNELHSGTQVFYTLEEAVEWITE
ncbi:hypothetical protein ACFL67_01460 [candidate division KSB1 bacterium]